MVARKDELLKDIDAVLGSTSAAVASIGSGNGPGYVEVGRSQMLIYACIDRIAAGTVSAPDGSARKASSLNADLAKTAPPAISKLDEKQITAWLDLRNKAAHGKFGDYAKEQVALMLQGVRDFLVRVPA